MAGNSRIEDLYFRFINGFVADLKSDEFYDYFINMVKGGTNNMTLNEKYVERNIDIRWVEAIEDTIIPLDNIIRNPNRFIKNIEEVVNIEMARNISTESVRHLATHTNYIAQVKGDEVIPSRILNVMKEESFETYENRFIFTLLFKLEYFLDKRMQVLMTNNKVADKYEMKFEGSCTAGHDEIEYDFSMNYVTPHIELTSEELQVGADITNLTSMQRIERLRKILYSFKGAPLIRALEHCAMVRPPLTMTNVLSKNPNFRKCVDLWRFIDRYEDVGFSVNVVDRFSTPSEQYVNDMFSLLTMQYVVMKKNTRHTDELGDYTERKKELELNVVKKSIEDIISTYDLDINEIRRIFTDQLEKKKKKVKAEFTKINEIIKRAIANDKEYLAEFNETREVREGKASMRLKAEKAAQKQEELAKLEAQKHLHDDSPFQSHVETTEQEKEQEKITAKATETETETKTETTTENKPVETEQVEQKVEETTETTKTAEAVETTETVEQVAEEKSAEQQVDETIEAQKVEDAETVEQVQLVETEQVENVEVEQVQTTKVDETQQQLEDKQHSQTAKVVQNTEQLNLAKPTTENRQKFEILEVIEEEKSTPVEQVAVVEVANSSQQQNTVEQQVVSVTDDNVKSTKDDETDTDKEDETDGDGNQNHSNETTATTTVKGDYKTPTKFEFVEMTEEFEPKVVIEPMVLNELIVVDEPMEVNEPIQVYAKKETAVKHHKTRYPKRWTTSTAKNTQKEKELVDS
ncbi:MAG: hypothetical protein IKV38_00395 [Clostridia bacterium]|nr:hypothetical protein [Clostridia bacterium]